MKKLFSLFAAALLSAGMHAATVNVDITTGQQANGAAPVTLNVVGSELTVNYSFTNDVEWPNGGVEFNFSGPISNVTNLSYDLIGDLGVSEWLSFHVYLKDNNGTRWAVSPTASIGGTPTTWTTFEALPSTPLWGSASYPFIEAEFVAVGFLVNPAGNQTGSFQLRNIAVDYIENPEVAVDLSTATQANGDEAANISWSLNAQGELMVSYNLGAWGNGGPEFALPNLKDVKDIQFEFIGDGGLSSWTSFQVYLKDQNGVRWYNAGADLHISGVGEWTMQKYMPHNELWTSGATQGDTFVAIGFLANPGEPTNSTFGIRNVKVNLFPASAPGEYDYGEYIALNHYIIAGGSTEHLSTPVVADGALSATLTSTGEWENAGVEFALNNVTGVQAISYDYKGSAENVVWTSFQVYLVDENDVKWYNHDANLSINGGPTDWTHMEYMPTDELWTSAHVQGTTFKAIGFLANPMSATTAPFSIRNVKVICTGDPAPEPEGPTYDLTVTAAGMSTLMLPFTVSSLPAGVKAYDLSVADADIIATEVSAITPDEPVLIVAAAGTYTFEGEGSDDISSKTVVYHNGALHGTYVGCEVPTFEAGENCYVLQNHGGDVAFYQMVAGANSHINPYRAYLRATYNALAASPVAPRMRIVFQGQTPTAVESMDASACANRKVLVNGQLLIHKGQNLYTIQGQKVK